MVKQKAPRKSEPVAPINFRPGNFMGERIIVFADKWEISRGAAARRLCMLAVYEMPLRLCDSILELAGYLYSGPSNTRGFDEAASRIYDELLKARKEARSPEPLSATKNQMIARAVVKEYRLLHDLK